MPYFSLLKCSLSIGFAATPFGFLRYFLQLQVYLGASMPIQNPSYPMSLASSEGFRSPLPSFSPNTVSVTLFRFRDLLSGLYPQVSLSFLKLNSRESWNPSTTLCRGAVLYAQRLDEPAPAYMTHVGHGDSDANHDCSRLYCIASLSLMRLEGKKCLFTVCAQY